MKVVMALVGVFVVASLTLAAADVSGRWSGTFAATPPGGESRTLPVFVILKQDGTSLTGSIGNTESDQRAFRNGKVDGDRLTFEIASPNGTLQRFDLKASGERIEGDVRAVTADGTERAGGRITLSRAAEK